jgi:hypothetical protein
MWSYSMASSRTSGPCGEIPLFKVFLPPREVLMPRLEEVLYSGQISEGAPVAEFERQFGALVDSPHILSFYSGTAALHAALVLAGVKRGDEVISTAMTAEPTNMAILHAGAKIVWADVDPTNGNLTAQSVAEKHNGSHSRDHGSALRRNSCAHRRHPQSCYGARNSRY